MFAGFPLPAEYYLYQLRNKLQRMLAASTSICNSPAGKFNSTDNFSKHQTVEKLTDISPEEWSTKISSDSSPSNKTDTDFSPYSSSKQRQKKLINRRGKKRGRRILLIDLSHVANSPCTQFRPSARPLFYSDPLAVD